MSAVVIQEVRDKPGKLVFLGVPFDVFKSDPHWIAPLYLERLEHLDPKKNPYFKHAEVQLFLALKDGKPVGRISAQIDRLHIELYRDATGQFGFLDAIDDPTVFKALLDAASAWLKSRGMKRMQGPFSFSINDETGLLIDGFDTPPSLFMGHAAPYYQRHMDVLGYVKAKDVIAYDYEVAKPLIPVIDRAWKRAAKGSRITVRPLNKKKVFDDIEIIMSIFNDAWSENWNFVPFTQDELKVLATNLKMLVHGEFVSIASIDGEPAAMAVTLPNVNEWVRDLDGKLLPFGWAKLLPRVIAKKPKSLRMPLMGVRRKYHDTTTGSALAFSVIMALREYHMSRGAERVEFGWVLEDNKGMRNIVETAGATPYKTYRVYEKNL
jgi:hypothetical protein